MSNDELLPRMNCAVDATMSVIEGRWKTVILCKLCTKGSLRFNQLVKEIEGVSPRILTKQLKELENDGVIDRKVFSDVPLRVEYSITEKGRSLIPLLQMMAEWGLKNMFSNRVRFDDNVQIPCGSEQS